jgi:hypothetical protein
MVVNELRGKPQRSHLKPTVVDAATTRQQFPALPPVLASPRPLVRLM